MNATAHIQRRHQNGQVVRSFRGVVIKGQTNAEKWQAQITAESVQEIEARMRRVKLGNFLTRFCQGASTFGMYHYMQLQFVYLPLVRRAAELETQALLAPQAHADWTEANRKANTAAAIIKRRKKRGSSAQARRLRERLLAESGAYKVSRRDVLIMRESAKRLRERAAAMLADSIREVYARVPNDKVRIIADNFFSLFV